MSMLHSDAATPDDLIPRMGNLPISNARYFQSAVITRVTEPTPDPQEIPFWNLFGIMTHAHDAQGRDVEVTSLVFSSDGNKIASADSSGVIRIWDSSTLQPVAHPLNDHTGGVVSIAFSPDGSLLASADVIGTVRIWDVTTGVQTRQPMHDLSHIAVGVDFDGEGRLLAGPTEDAIALFNISDGSRVKPLMPAQQDEFTVARAIFGASGIQMLGGSRDGSVGFWREGGSGMVVQGIGRHNGAVTSVALSPDGSVGISGGEDGTIRFWKPTTGETIEFEGFVGHPRTTIDDLAFNADGSLFVSAGWDGTVRMWNRDGFQLNNPMTSSPDRFTAIAFSPNSAKFAAGGNDGSVTVWFDATHAITRPLTLPKPAEAVARPTARPAVGVLLTHEQSWTMEGIALGELLHSVCLAPGEITQLAVTNHTRGVMENSADTVSQSEDLSQRGVSSSALSEAEQALADEKSFGVSFGTSTSTTSGSGLGGALGFLGVSAGAALSSSAATNVSVSSGTRHVSDESTQAVHQNTAQAARLARSRFAASIREVSESDALELRTRVVANYNHMHALTLQYYEVVQVQRLTTTVINAHRLLFVPMRAIEFSAVETTRSALRRYPHELAATLRSLGFYGAATCIDHLMLGYDGGHDLRQYRVNQIWENVVQLKADLDAAQQPLTAARTRAIVTADTVLKARDALRQAKNPGLAERAKLQRTLQAATQDAALASQELHRQSMTESELRQKLAAAERVKQELSQLLGAHDAPASNNAPAMPSAETGPSIDTTTLGEVEDRVYQLLVDNQLAVNQGLWIRLDPSTYAALLEGMTFEGESITKTLDPTPVAVSGNYVAFRWHHADPMDALRFRHEYVSTAQMFQDTIAVPTGGVFGEAVLGESNAADTIDITRFWNWKDALPPLRPAEIDALQQSDETPLATPTLPTAPASAIDLGPVTFPEVATGIPNLIEALKNPDLFRDLSGTKASAALAQSALALSQTNAVETAAMASKNFQRHLQLQQKIAAAALDAMGSLGNETFDPTMAGAILNANGGSPSGGRGDGSPAERDGSTSGATRGSAGGGDASDGTTQVAFEAEGPTGSGGNTGGRIP